MNPIIDSIYDLSPEFLGQLKNYVEQAGLSIPIAQIPGFTQFTAQVSVDSGGSTSSHSYVNLGSGPQFTGLRPGKYAFLFGSKQSNTAGNNAQMALSVNSGTPSSTYVAQIPSGQFTAMVDLETLTSDTNTVRAQFLVVSAGTDTSTFTNPWILALKYA